MANKFINIFFLYLRVILGAIVSNFLYFWVFLEINSLIFLLILSSGANSLFSSSLIKYYFFQSLRSSIFLVTIIWVYLNRFYRGGLNIILILRIFIKLGIMPFHFWVVRVVGFIRWENFFLIISLQKILPIILIKRLTIGNLLIYYCLLNIIFSSFIVLSQLIFKKMLVFTSIFTIRWVLPLLGPRFFLAITIFILYLFLLFNLVAFIKAYSLNFLQQGFLKQISFLEKIIKFIFIASLGGVPPFLGFFIKINLLLELQKVGVPIIFVILILILSVVVLNFYISINLSNLTSIKSIFFLKKISTFSQYGGILILTNFLPVLFLVLILARWRYFENINWSLHSRAIIQPKSN